MLDAFKRNVEKLPNHDMIGSRVGQEFQWKTWSWVDDQSLNIGYGIEALNLAPEISAEN